MKVNRKRNRLRATELLAALEPRQMMTVDLTGAFLVSPVAALSGSTQPMAVTVSNSGDTKATGTLVLAMYIAPDGEAFDVNTATFLGKVSRTASVGASGGTQNVSFSMKLSAALAAGDYRLYAVIDPDNKIVESNDANNLATSGLVSVVQPNYDLAASFGAGAFVVPSVVLGAKTNGTVPVVITNPGSSSVALPAGLSVAVTVVARPVGGGSDVVINKSAVKAAVGGLGVGKSKTVNVAVQFPDTLVAGNYDVIALVDSAGVLAEVDEGNNDATLAHPVSVAAAFSDPSLAFGATVTIPANVVADGRNLPVKVDIANQGNVTIPGGVTGSVTIVAHNVGTSSDTVLGVFTVQLGGIGSGKTKTFALTPTVVGGLGGLANGQYRIDAVVSTGIAGDVVGNNSDSAATTMTVGNAFYNIAPTDAVSKIPPAIQSGLPVPGMIDVGIKNLSNTKLPSPMRANVVLVLRPVGEDSDNEDITIGTANVGIGGLAIGGTQNFHLGVKIPTTVNGDPVDLGTYIVVTKVTPVGLTETTTADNESEGDTITIAPPFVDLAIVSASNTFPLPAPVGSSGIGRVVLRNLGNVTVQGNVTIQFLASPTGNINSGVAIGSRALSVVLLPGQTSTVLNVPLTLSTPANGFLSSEYTVFARIDPASFSDAVGGNNVRGAGEVVVSSQSVDLRITATSQPFGSSANAGATGTGQVTIGNFGSGISSGDVTIKFYASLGTTLDGSEVQIGTMDVNVVLAAAQLTTPVSVPLTLPTPGVPTTYRILATIESSLSVDNNPNNNVTTVIGTVLVSPVPG